MIGNKWVVGVSINFASNGAATMGRLASQSRLANAQLAAQQGLITRNQLAMARYQERMEALRMAALKLGAAMSAAFAGIGVAAITTGVEEAAKFQRAMTGVFIATSGASASQRAAMQRQAVQVSGYTAQSAVTIANEMSVAAQTAFKDPNVLMRLFPMMAKYADVRYMASGGKEDAVGTVEKMTQFAHLFQAYGPGAMQRMLDLSAKLQFTAHTTLQQLVTQGRMFIPNAVRAGVSEDTLFQWITIAAQNGFMQGRGGTALNNVLLNAMSVSPTAHLSKAKAKGLRELELRDPSGSFRFLDAQGHVQAERMMNWLHGEESKFVSRYGQRDANSRWLTDIGAVFGKEGQRFVSLVATAATREQMDRNKAAFARIPGVDGQWTKYFSDLFYQFNAFTTNIKNLAMVIALPALPELTAMFKSFASSLGNMVAYLSDHPNVALNLAHGIAAVSVAFGGLAAVLSGQLILGGLGLGGFAGLFSTISTGLGGWAIALRILAPRLVAFVPVVGWAAAAIFTAIEAFKHAKDIAWVLGAMGGYIQFKLWPGIVTAWKHGIDSLGVQFANALANMFSGVAAIINPSSMGTGGAKALQSLGASHGVSDFLSDVWNKIGNAGSQTDWSKALGAGYATQAPTSVTLQIDARGHSDPHKAGQIIGAAVVHQMNTAGLTRHATLGPGVGSAQPAHH